MTTVQGIKDILLGNVEKPRMIIQVFKHHNDQMKALEGIDFLQTQTSELSFTSLHPLRFFRSWMSSLREPAKVTRQIIHYLIFFPGSFCLP